MLFFFSLMFICFNVYSLNAYYKQQRGRYHNHNHNYHALDQRKCEKNIKINNGVEVSASVTVSMNENMYCKHKKKLLVALAALAYITDMIINNRHLPLACHQFIRPMNLNARHNCDVISTRAFNTQYSQQMVKNADNLTRHTQSFNTFFTSSFEFNVVFCFATRARIIARI